MSISQSDTLIFDGVLCFGGIDWWYHNRAHSEVQIMCRMAERLPVLFVNSLGMRTPTPGRSTQPFQRILRKAKSIVRGLRKVGPRMWVYSPIILPPSSRPLLRKLNARLVGAQVRLVLKILGIRRWFTWVTVPTACDVLDRLPESLTIFNRSDAFSKFPEAREEYIRSCEHKMLTRSDLTLYVNNRLMEEDTGPADRKYYIGHGVDFDLFARAAQERRHCPEYASIPRPIVGFFGAIDDYTVDLKLLKRCAETLTDMSFVLIGLSTLDISDITDLPNVHYLGFRPYGEIPRLGAAFDVGIMPWLEADWIAYCNPIKLKEYLALGLPIVTTPIPQATEYADVLCVAKTADEFTAAIRRCVSENSEQTRAKRRQRVQNDSWQNKAGEILMLVETLARRRASS
jgi:glycosyltransferase involved in cell wall biosynthesis